MELFHPCMLPEIVQSTSYRPMTSSIRPLSTPQLPKCIDFNEVYEPAEDSFLLLDALEHDLDTLVSSKPLICLEVGSGSGVITAALAKVLRGSMFFVTDLNEHACKASRKTFELNSVSGNTQVLCTSLFDGMRKSFLENNVDLVLCNPPYVAVDDDEDERDKSSKLAMAWAGGRMSAGRTLIDLLLLNLSILLKPRSGSAFLVFEQCNRPEQVLLYAQNECGLKGEEVMRRRAGRELLSVFRFQRGDTNT